MYSDEHPCCGTDAAEEIDLEGDSDLIEGVDEDGNKVLLQIVRYFYYNGEEYVVLGDAQSEDDCECDCEDCESCHPVADDSADEDEEAINLYIMKVVQSEEDGEDMEEFVPVEDEALLDKLIKVVQTDFDKVGQDE